MYEGRSFIFLLFIFSAYFSCRNHFLLGCSNDKQASQSHMLVKPDPTPRTHMFQIKSHRIFFSTGFQWIRADNLRSPTYLVRLQNRTFYLLMFCYQVLAFFYNLVCIILFPALSHILLHTIYRIPTSCFSSKECEGCRLCICWCGCT